MHRRVTRPRVQVVTPGARATRNLRRRSVLHYVVTCFDWPLWCLRSTSRRLRFAITAIWRLPMRVQIGASIVALALCSGGFLLLWMLHDPFVEVGKRRQRFGEARSALGVAMNRYCANFARHQAGPWRVADANMRREWLREAVAGIDGHGDDRRLVSRAVRKYHRSALQLASAARAAAERYRDNSKRVVPEARIALLSLANQADREAVVLTEHAAQTQLRWQGIDEGFEQLSSIPGFFGQDVALFESVHGVRGSEYITELQQLSNRFDQLIKQLDQFIRLIDHSQNIVIESDLQTTSD